jgi:hypothetical protein
LSRVRLVTKSDEQSRDAVLNVLLIEVDEQCKSLVRQAQVCQHCLLVFWMYILDGLDLNDHFTPDKQIDAKAFIKADIVVNNVDRHLAIGV